MKTLTFKYLKLFLLAVAMINLTSCEIEIDDFYDDDNIGGSYYNCLLYTSPSPRDCS